MHLASMVNAIRDAGRRYCDDNLVQIANRLANYTKESSNEVPRVALSVPEAARAAGLSKDWVWKLVAAGAIPSKKLGKRRLILVEDLKRYLGDTQ